MEPKKIAWLVAVCASTNAELGENWLRLQLVSNKLRNLEDNQSRSVLYEAGCWHEHEDVLDRLRSNVLGMDIFLQVQEDYLRRISEEEKIDPLDIGLNFQPTELFTEVAPNWEPPAIIPEISGAGLENYRFTSARDQNWISRVNYIEPTASKGPPNPSGQWEDGTGWLAKLKYQ